MSGISPGGHPNYDLKGRMLVKIIIGVIVSVALFGGIAGMLKLRGGGEQVKTIEVRVEPVTRGELAEIVTAPGQIQPKTKVTISAKTTARIVEIPFEEGASVKRDDLVVQLDSKDLEAQLKGAQA